MQIFINEKGTKRLTWSKTVRKKKFEQRKKEIIKKPGIKENNVLCEKKKRLMERKENVEKGTL